MKRFLALIVSAILLLSVSLAENTVAGAEQAAAESTAAYSPITFSVGENGEYECVMTGFAAQDADTIRELIRNAAPAQPVELSSIVDAEKTSLNAGVDSLLCWAGSSSNMLWLSGWAQQCVNPITGKAFASEDEVFDYFRSRFTDGGSSQPTGLSWFFNGIFSQEEDKTEDEEKEAIALLKDGSAESDGLMKQYSAGAVLQEYPNSCLESVKNLDTALQALKEGNIVGLCIDGHALTVLGYVCDPSAQGTTGYYKSLIIADSDNSVKGYTSAPAERPNTATVYTLVYQEANQDDEPAVYVITDYTPNVNRYITSYIVLKPYNEKTIAEITETDAQATLNAVTTPDCVIEQLYFTSLSDEDHLFYSLNQQTFYEDSDAVYVGVQLLNKSSTALKDTVYAKVTVTREEDGESHTVFLPMNEGTEVPALGHANQTVDLCKLFDTVLGTYHVSAEINPADGPAGQVQEAYYLNNSYLETTIQINEAVSADDTQYDHEVSEQQVLIADGIGLCELPFPNGSWGIHVIRDASDLRALEVSPYSDNTVWTAVPESAYSVVLDDDGTFRLEFTEEYITSLGFGDFTIRADLDGEFHTVDFSVMKADPVTD